MVELMSSMRPGGVAHGHSLLGAIDYVGLGGLGLPRLDRGELDEVLDLLDGRDRVGMEFFGKELIDLPVQAKAPD